MLVSRAKFGYTFLVERTLKLVSSFEEAEQLDLEQWAAVSGRDRLLAGEAMRDEWAKRDGQSGLQRILRVAERSEG